MSLRPVVALYSHRLGWKEGTGIASYVEGLVSALATREELDYRLCASPEPSSSAASLGGCDPLGGGGFGLLRSRPGGPPAGELPESLAAGGLVPLRPRLPRKLLHASWTWLGRPAVDRWSGFPALVHVLYPSCPVPSRAPLLYTIHDLMPLRFPQWFDAPERTMFARAVYHAARHAAKIICNSRCTAREVATVLGVEPERIHVVPLGVAGRFRSPAPAEAVASACRRWGVLPGCYVVALGAVSARKDLGTVVEALSLLDRPSPRCAGLGAGAPPQRGPASPEGSFPRGASRLAPGLSLVAVGPGGGDAQVLSEKARALGLSGRVVLTGWRPHAEVAALLQGAAALVHPSLYEGFGITPLEAMAAGVPVVVSDTGALPETVGDGALVVPAGDPSAWAQAIQQVVEDELLRADLTRRGLRRAAGFTWAKAATATAGVHLSVLASQGAAASASKMVSSRMDCLAEPAGPGQVRA